MFQLRIYFVVIFFYFYLLPYIFYFSLSRSCLAISLFCDVNLLLCKRIMLSYCLCWNSHLICAECSAEEGVHRRSFRVAIGQGKSGKPGKGREIGFLPGIPGTGNSREFPTCFASRFPGNNTRDPGKSKNAEILMKINIPERGMAPAGLLLNHIFQFGDSGKSLKKWKLITSTIA